MRKLYMAIPMLLLATPVMAQAEQPADCIRFENIEWKPLAGDEVSWKVDVVNTCTESKSIGFEIEFLDAEGFQVEMTYGRTTVQAGQTKISRGTWHIEKHKADRIATVIASR